MGSNQADVLIGNGLSNVLDGGNGNDDIWSNGGDDFMYGGRDSDTYRFQLGDGNDTINEKRLGGRDKIVLESFPTLQSIDQISFRREYRDLIVDLTFGTELSEGSIRIKDQRWGASRVETLTINNVDIDLVSVYDQTLAFNQQFQLTTTSSTFGFLVTPV